MSRAPDTVIQLAPGQTAVVGYGSLLSIASIGKTLGRTYTAPFVFCHVDGWRRSWDVSMPNQAFYYVDGVERVYPKRIIYLNVDRAPGELLNVVVFVVNEVELRAMHAREWIYDAVSVTGELRGVQITGGNAVMYVAKPEHRVRAVESPREGAVRASYLRILQGALALVDESFRDEYRRTTDGPAADLVVEDNLDPERPNPWAVAGYDYKPQIRL